METRGRKKLCPKLPTTEDDDVAAEKEDAKRDAMETESDNKESKRPDENKLEEPVNENQQKSDNKESKRPDENKLEEPVNENQQKSDNKESKRPDENKLEEPVNENQQKLYPELPQIDGSEVNGSEAKHKTEEENNYMLYVIIAVFFVLLSFWWINPSFYDKSDGFVNVTQFKRNLDNLRGNFTHQSPQLWKSIEKLGAGHLRETREKSVRRPLVLLLLSNHGNDIILKCLAKKIASAFADSEHSHLIDGNDVVMQAQSKEELDTKLEKILKSAPNGKTVAIVTNIGSLTYDIASIFFKYCDTEGSPYPNAVFVFTLAINNDEILLEKSSKEITQATWKHLSQVTWKDGTPAQRDALIARIVDPAPILVQNEDKTIKDTCLS